MEKPLMLIFAPMILVGVVMILTSLLMRTSAHPPLGSLKPKNWIPIWKMKSWFTPRGYKFHMTGWLFFLAGDLGMLAYWLQQ